MSENIAMIASLLGGAKGEEAKAIMTGGTTAGQEADAETFSLLLEQASTEVSENGSGSEAETEEVLVDVGEQLETGGTNESDTDESGAILKPVLPIGSEQDVDILPVSGTQTGHAGQGKATEHAEPSSATKASSINGQQAVERIGVGAPSSLSGIPGKSQGQVMVNPEQTLEDRGVVKPTTVSQQPKPDVNIGELQGNKAAPTETAKPSGEMTEAPRGLIKATAVASAQSTGPSLAAEKVVTNGSEHQSENAEASKTKGQTGRGLERAVEAIRTAEARISSLEVKPLPVEPAQGVKTAAEISRPSGTVVLEDAPKVSTETVRPTDPVRVKANVDGQVTTEASAKPSGTSAQGGSGSQNGTLGQQAQSQQAPTPPPVAPQSTVPTASTAPVAQAAPVLQEVQPQPVPTSSSTTGSGASTSGSYSSTLDLTNDVALKGEAMRIAGNLKAFGSRGGTASLLLKPENLGTVHVKMEIEAGRLVARMVVESVAAEAALKKALPQLEQAFRGQGFSDVRINLATGNPNLAFMGEAGGRSNSQGRGNKSNDNNNVGSLDEQRETSVEQSPQYSLSGSAKSVDIVV